MDLEKELGSSVIKKSKASRDWQYRALLTNTAGHGGKEVAVVLGRSEYPCCFRGVNKSHFSVRYYSKKSVDAWRNPRQAAYRYQS